MCNVLFKVNDEYVKHTTTLQLFWDNPVIRLLVLKGCYTTEFLKYVLGDDIHQDKVLLFNAREMLVKTDFRIYVNGKDGLSKLLNVPVSFLDTVNVVLYDGKKAPPYSYFSFYERWDDRPKLVKPIHDDFLKAFKLQGYEDELIIVPLYSKFLNSCDECYKLAYVLFRNI
jgi:hypothetical protein